MCAGRARRAWTAEIGRLTVLFGLGQAGGPLLSGYLSDGAGGVRLGLLASIAMTVAGAAVVAFQDEP